MRLLVKIDKCEYCNKSATWIYIYSFFTMRAVLVCDEHRMMYSGEIKRT